MSQQSRITYADIAKQAGVSEATVSRVLNGDTRVKADRQERVNAAVAELGYKKNRIASALASGRTGLIAIVIDDDLSIFDDPFWARVSRGVSRVLMQNELQTLLLVSSETTLDSPVAHYLQGGEVDGAIFFQVHNDQLIKQLQAQGLAVVMAGTPQAGTKVPFADSDNFGGAVQATTHLISSGCQHLVTITGDVDASAGRQRLEGFKQAISQHGLSVDKKLIVRGDYSFESGRSAMSKLLIAGSKIDGVFAANDLMALGAMAEIREFGLRVPEDIRVVGFDDSVMSMASVPTLTTVRQDIEGLGEAVAELMINQLQSNAVTPKILPTTLVARDSA